MEIPIPNDLLFELDPDYGDYIPDFSPPAIPLVSVSMLNALADAGVNNIDSYNATILDREGKPIPEDFRAINIIGRIG